MTKIFKLACAEFNKILLRPSIFILTAILVVTIAITNLSFAPETMSNDIVYTDTSVSTTYLTFLSSSSTVTTKSSIDEVLNNAYNDVQVKYDNITIDHLQDIEDSVLYVNALMTTTNIQDMIILLKQDEYDTAAFNSAKTFLTSLKTESNKLFAKLSKIKTDLETKPINFYVTESQLDKVINQSKLIANTIPNTFDEYTNTTLAAFLSVLSADYTIDTSIFASFAKNKLIIDEQVYNDLIKQYYTDALLTLDEKNAEIILFYNTVRSDSDKNSDSKNISHLVKLINEYNSIAKVNANNLQNKFLLLTIGQQNQNKLNTYIGFENIDIYDLREDVLLDDYIIENSAYDNDYLKSFNFNQASSNNANVYDYLFYTMQIIMIFVILFTVYYACSSVAGDMQSGTMKMIAIRPVTRGQLLAGKYLSCIFFALTLIFVSTLATLAAGVYAFGFTTSPVLLAYDATVVYLLSPLAVMCFYMLSLFANMLFYISLAFMLSLVLKSNTLAIAISGITYFLQLVLTSFVSKNWIIYTPFAHFDLFKYFGNSQSGFLSLDVIGGTNFVLSLIVLLGLTLVMYIVSHLIFKNRDVA